MIRLSLIAFLTLSATVSYGSVWNEMQDGEVSAVEGKVTDVNPRQGAIYLTVNTDNGLGEAVTKTVKVCATENDYYRTEAEKAVVFSQQLQSFREARKSKKTIRLSYKGPWDPCVTPSSL